MALWLAIHPGTVMALFLTLSYGSSPKDLSVASFAPLLKFYIGKRMLDGLGWGRVRLSFARKETVGHSAKLGEFGISI